MLESLSALGKRVVEKDVKDQEAFDKVKTATMDAKTATTDVRITSMDDKTATMIGSINGIV